MGPFREVPGGGNGLLPGVPERGAGGPPGTGGQSRLSHRSSGGWPGVPIKSGF